MELDLNDGIDDALLSELFGWDDSPWNQSESVEGFDEFVKYHSTPDDEFASFYFPEDFSVCSIHAIYKCHDEPYPFHTILNTLDALKVPVSQDFENNSYFLSEYSVAAYLCKATRGCADCCFLIGMILVYWTWPWSVFSIYSVRNDGLFLIRMAADLNQMEAIHFLANIELDARLASRRPLANRKILETLRRAEMTGLVDDYSLVCQLWEHRHISESPRREIRQLHMFAETGYPPAIEELGRALYLDHSEKSAIYWLQKSAENGNTQAARLVALHDQSNHLHRRKQTNFEA